MKTLVSMFIICFVALTAMSGCAAVSDYTINGIDLGEFDQASSTDRWKMAAGIGASALVHWGSHALYLETQDIDWHQEGFHEYIERAWEISDSKRGNIGRAGPTGQLAATYVLTYGPWGDEFKKGYFLKGFKLMTAGQIWTSPLFDAGDLSWIEKSGGNADLEWPLYSIAAVIPWIERRTN